MGSRCEHLSQRRVLLTVLDRVQAEQGGLRGRIDLGRVQPKPSLSRGVGGIDRDGPRHLFIALGQHRVGAAAHFSQAHEVEFGSSTTMRRSVSISSRSRITPSE